MIMTSPSRSTAKQTPATISDRVSAYRDRLATSSYHRVDLVMPDEKRDRIKKIASEANGSYAETVSALAQFGLDQMEMLVAQEKNRAAEPLIPQVFAAHVSGAMAPSMRGELIGASAQGASQLSSKIDEALGATPRAFLMNISGRGLNDAIDSGNARTLFSSPSPTASDTSAVSALTAFFRKQKAKDD